MIELNKPIGEGENKNYDFQHVIIKTSKFYALAIMQQKRRGFLQNKLQTTIVIPEMGLNLVGKDH